MLCLTVHLLARPAKDREAQQTRPVFFAHSHLPTATGIRSPPDRIARPGRRSHAGAARVRA